MKTNKQAQLLVGIMLLMGHLICFAQEPNYVQTNTYINIKKLPDNSYTYDNIITRLYYDGLGRDIQPQTVINGISDKKIVSGIKYDDLGRICKTFNPFVESGEFKYIPQSELETKANNYWDGSNGKPDAQDKAFSEVEYWLDPLNRVKKTGSPGLEYSLSGEHYPRMWYFGSCENGTKGLLAVTNENGFLFSVFLNIHDLDAFQEAGKIDLDQELNLFLSVSMNPHGKFSQQITDKFGNVRKRSDSDGNLLSEFESVVSGYKSNKFNWIQLSLFSSLMSMSWKACKMGIFSKIDTLITCKIV